MRLIDADKLETHEQLEPFGNGNYEYVEVVYKDDIDDAPTIGLERKKGEWIYENAYGWYRCGACKKVFSSAVISFFDNSHYKPRLNFCPNCGAMMEGEQHG